MSKKSLKKIIEEKVESSPTAENVISVFKALVATTGVGSGIASLISDVIPSSRFLRLEKFSKEVAIEFNKLKSDIDENYIKTEEFGFIFEKCYREVASNYQKEKLESFKAIIVNSAINHDLIEDEKEFFLNLTSNLSTLHLKIFKFLAFPKIYLRENDIPEEIINGGFSAFFPKIFPGVKIDALKLAFQDLYGMGLLTTDKSIFSTITASQGWNLLGDRVSEFGRKFINFITIE